jgi:hypothetical protein
MTEVELNRLTFVLFIFEGVGELLGGGLMIFASHLIVNPANVIMVMSTSFLVAVLLISLGSLSSNVYLMGVGVVVTGFSDCTCFVLGLSVAGEWKRRGVAVFNVCQSLTVAVSVILFVFVPYYAALVWMGVFYIWNVVGLIVYRRKVRQRESAYQK